jgi:hypothetical protein
LDSACSTKITPQLKLAPKVRNTCIDQIYGEPKITNIARENLIAQRYGDIIIEHFNLKSWQRYVESPIHAWTKINGEPKIMNIASGN